MLVYGDPALSCTAEALVQGLTHRISQVRLSPGPDVDLLRTLVIHAGQVEQAFDDDCPDEGTATCDTLHQSAAIRALTDAAARAFVAAWTPQGRSIDMLVRQELAECGRLAGRLHGGPARLTLKIPEGFAFYNLFPEQYAAAARRWSDAHRGAQPAGVRVVGIRSIGTTLSAVVQAQLHAEGWFAHRLTVRPTGHPFDRNVQLPPAHPPDVFALVVDEGPGLSGSSFVATQRALVAAGFPAGCIEFLPGHAGAPGSAASPQTRTIWNSTRRTTVALEDIRWRGQSFSELLLASSARELQSPLVEGFDCGGGLWRRWLDLPPQDWPPAWPMFESAKHLYRVPGGPGLLWKFSGLAVDASGISLADAADARLQARARGGWTVAPVDQQLGFLALPWISGRALTRLDKTPALVRKMATYIASVSGPELPRDEQRASFLRLEQMLSHNTQAALGSAAAETAARLAARACAVLLSQPWRRTGDGRLAPHEWLLTPDGRLLKTDAAGHHLDHTLIGPQPVLWDLAVLAVDWDLKPPGIRTALNTVLAPAHDADLAAVLDFHRAAYAAFRVGQCVLARSAAGPRFDIPLEHAEAFYRAQLEARLREQIHSRL